MNKPDSSRFRARYLVETAGDVRRAAETMAGEQSAGTFVAVPGETEELRERHGARVEQITPLETALQPSLPGSRVPGDGTTSEYHRAEVLLSFPTENVGESLPQLLTTVAGNLFELAPFSGLRLLDLEIPAGVVERAPGPQFGVAGTRRLAGVDTGPLIGTIIKPSVGLSPEETAELVKVLVEAGVDFIKDDELIADAPYSRLGDRVSAVMAVIDDHAQRTGRRVMYAANITGEIDEMRARHDAVVASGGTCVMVSLLSVGLAGVSALRRHSGVPIHGHRNGWGALMRHPLLGFEFTAMQKFWRLAGADHLHVNGIDNKFTETNDSVIESARACLVPIGAHDEAMPVFSSGQWAGTAAATLAATGSADLIHVAGGGIMAHPDGPGDGVLSLRQAWDAALAGEDLESYALEHRALQRSIEKFGSG